MPPSSIRRFSTCPGSGTLSIAGGGDASLGNAESVNIAFGAGGGTLSVGNAAALAGMMTDWQAGDMMNLRNTAATSESFSAGTLSLYGAANNLLGTLHFAGSLTTANFAVSSSGAEGALISWQKT